MSARDLEIKDIQISAYTVPTDLPESDGTLEWNSTTIIIVQIKAGEYKGIGYTYAGISAAVLIRNQLVHLILGRSALSICQNWQAMIDAIRNLGRPGIASMAIAAVDNALWDLKAKILGISLVDLLGRYRSSILVYGSGGFTSYSIDQLQKQLRGWIQNGFKAVKMKVGRHPDQDVQRVRKAREAIGKDPLLFVDANGAFNRKQALQMAKEFSELGVSWFEEPVTSDDLEGLHFMRQNGPTGMQITAGEYGYDQTYFLRMLNASSVDVLQIDATRCAGISGFLQAAALCDAFHIPISAHTAPSIHAHLCCAVRPAVHVEYFHDHERIEHLFFEGALTPVEGKLYPDLKRPGLGLEFIHKNAEPYKVDF